MPASSPRADTAGDPAAVLELQHRAGNASVTWLVRASRRALARQPKTDGAVTHTFVLGKDVTLAFAEKAKSLVKDGRVAPDQLVPLRELALKRGIAKAAPEGTVGDAERMFMAGLLDPANAAALAKTKLGSGKSVTMSFSRSTTTANLRAAADVGRPKRSSEAEDKQILALATPGYEGMARDVIAFANTAKIPLADVLAAMIAAASDSTPADLALAGAVYAIAANAKHPMAADVRAGNVKVDAVSKLPARRGHPGAAAAYVSQGAGGREKGDTVYVKPTLKLADLNDRSLVIHELEHAAHDKAAGAARDLADEELSAYRAQAQYAVAQINAGDREQGMADIAGAWNIGLVCGFVLVAQAKPVLGVMLQRLNKMSKAANKPSTADIEMFIADENFERRGAEMLRIMEKIPADALTAYEGLRGESLLQAGKP